MSCNSGVHASQPTANTVGAPDLEAGWAAGRGSNGNCPDCGGWLRKEDRGCTKCERRGKAYLSDPTFAQNMTPAAIALAHPAMQMAAVRGDADDDMLTALQQATDPYVRAAARARRAAHDGGMSHGRVHPSPLSVRPSPAMADVVAAAESTGESLVLSRHWKTEFAGKPPRKFTLRNGETLKAGQRFSGDEYSVSLGKARRQATVGATITRAVDQIEMWEVTGQGAIRATTFDGGSGYYDPDNYAVCCGGGCDDSQAGLCHHQMAAIIAGEVSRNRDALPAGELQELHEQLVRELTGPTSPSSPDYTPAVVRGGDAVYAYLKTAVPEVQINVESLNPSASASTPEPAAASTGPRRCPACKKFLRADGGCTSCERRAEKEGEGTSRPAVSPPVGGPPSARGTTTTRSGLARQAHPDVVALLDDLVVQSPLPATADMMADDPAMAAYAGFPVPASNPRYVVDDQARRVMTTVMRRVGHAWAGARRRVEAAGGDPDNPDAYPPAMEDRCWGLYGPPSTGKNSLARELAAGLGLGYMEIDVRDRTDFQALLCDVVFPKEGDKTYSEIRLGPVGRALVEGNVVAINEIVSADPDAQTALHQVLQDGVIRAPGPEGATRFWKVHANSIVFLTWNPNVTREDKPGEALLSRTATLRMDYPQPGDEARRLASEMSDYLGKKVSPGDVKRQVNLIRGLRELHERGDLETCPTYRELVGFAKEYALNGGDRHKAAELLRVLCVQGPGHEDQWAQVENLVDSFNAGTWRIH